MGMRNYPLLVIVVLLSFIPHFVFAVMLEGISIQDLDTRQILPVQPASPAAPQTCEKNGKNDICCSVRIALKGDASIVERYQPYSEHGADFSACQKMLKQWNTNPAEAKNAQICRTAVFREYAGRYIYYDLMDQLHLGSRCEDKNKEMDQARVDAAELAQRKIAAAEMEVRAAAERNLAFYEDGDTRVVGTNGWRELPDQFRTDWQNLPRGASSWSRSFDPSFTPTPAPLQLLRGSEPLPLFEQHGTYGKIEPTNQNALGFEWDVFRPSPPPSEVVIASAPPEYTEFKAPDLGSFSPSESPGQQTAPPPTRQGGADTNPDPGPPTQRAPQPQPRPGPGMNNPNNNPWGPNNPWGNNGLGGGFGGQNMNSMMTQMMMGNMMRASTQQLQQQAQQRAQQEQQTPPALAASLTLNVQPTLVKRGNPISVSWTSVSMSTASPCTVTQSGTTIGRGNTGSVTVSTTASSTPGSVLFRLVCQAAGNNQVFEKNTTVVVQ